MYYQSRINQILDISQKPILEQIELLKNLSIGNALKLNHIIWVNDENPSGTGIKVLAVLYQKESQYFQFESITIAWCKDREIKNFIETFSKIENLKNDYNIEKLKPTKLNNTETLRTFICGCCGIDFKSTIKLQSKFDQDQGYGSCNHCITL